MVAFIGRLLFRAARRAQLGYFANVGSNREEQFLDLLCLARPGARFLRMISLSIIDVPRVKRRELKS